jgi:hypothetical protein
MFSIHLTAEPSDLEWMMSVDGEQKQEGNRTGELVHSARKVLKDKLVVGIKRILEKMKIFEN